MINKKIKRNLWLYIGSFFSVCIILLIVLKIMGISPFGDATLANYDGYIQYLDFFAWFKDVLEGKSTIAYSFSKSLGGTNIALYSYYLASPLNFLVVFFDKSQLNSFFDILAVLKLSLSALTCSIWLRKRFENSLDARWIYLLAIGYGVCQYNIAQSSNIMWLDGVILLPLMLLGVYRGIWKKNWWYLSIFSAVSILTNWYTGCINCLFTVIWVLAEQCLYVEEKHGKGIGIWLKKAAGYIISMITAVLLSAVLFLPSVKTLRGGRSNFDKDWLTNHMAGNIVTVLPGFSAGAQSSFSTSGYVALFCGSFAIAGCIGFFVSGTIRKKQKLILGAVIGISILLFYWQPLIFLFSLVRVVSSYWYRYSYLGMIGIIFCAAFSCQFLKKESKKSRWRLVLGAIIVSGAMVAVNHVYQQQNAKNVWLSAGVIIAISVLIWMLSTGGNRIRKAVLWSVLGISVIGELGISSSVLMNQYAYTNGAAEYQRYTFEQEKLISQIQEEDTSLYRMTQLKNRLVSDEHTTSTYNEALALGYRSLSSYTSALDMKQAVMLEKFGYRINGDTYNIVNTSILAADSLFGVKYVLSDRQINGTKQVSDISNYNGKETYENLYALPLAFKYQGDAISVEYKDDPFLYQNAVYSELLGENVQLYTPLEYEANGDDNHTVYSIKVPKTNSGLYGNLPWRTFYDGSVDVNNSYSTGYAKWASPSVFDIPTREGEQNATVTLYSEQQIDTYAEQFYTLDLSTLQYVTDKLREQKADNIELKDGYVHIETDGHQGESLFTSIPMDDGWSITLNGKDISPNLFSDCLITLPLEDGNNSIEMVYHIPGLKAGAGMTAIGGFILFLEMMLNLRKKEKSGR